MPLAAAARLTHVSARTVHRWCAAGIVPKRSRTGRSGSLVPLSAVSAAARHGGTPA